MKIFMSILYFSGISLFFLSTDVKAMSESDKSSLKQKTGLHKPVRSGPKDFQVVDLLQDPHLDKEGRIYYTSSTKRKDSVLNLKRKKVFSPKSQKKKKDL